MKVTYVWTTDVVNMQVTDTDNFWGLGDVVRGMITTGITCLEHGYSFDIDVSRHPLSHWLENGTAKASKNNKIHFIPTGKQNKLLDYIHSEKTDDVTLMTNAAFDRKNPHLKTVLKKVRDVFKPNDQVVKKLNTILDSLKITSKFQTLHLRVGDDYMVRKKDNRYKLNMIDGIVSQYDLSKTLIVSDSNIVKKYIRTNHPDSIMYDIDYITHIGLCDDKDHALNTFIEILLISNTNSIDSYTQYNHNSGFVNLINLLFNTPVSYKQQNIKWIV